MGAFHHEKAIHCQSASEKIQVKIALHAAALHRYLFGFHVIKEGISKAR